MPESTLTACTLLALAVNALGLAALFYFLKVIIMTKLEELQAKTDELVAKVEQGNTKTDALILTANTTKDALVALQGTIGAGTPITEADLQAIIDKQQGAIDSITAQEVETDAANTDVAP